VTKDTALLDDNRYSDLCRGQRMGAGPMEYIVCGAVLVGVFVFTMVLAAYALMG
jgi:hypothetical protein